VELRLDGQVALVTGGSRGIGRAIAQSFLEAGASVMITSRSREKLTEAVATLPGNVAWFAANAGDPDAPTVCVAATIERFGAVDILVNNAATNPYYGPLVELDAARADKTVQVNMRGLVLWSQAAWEAWMAEHGGTIINISSAGAFVTSHNVGYYNATKAAAVHLTRSLALELGPQVRVNAIAPGLVHTDMSEVLVTSFGDELAAKQPLKRLGVPEDIATAALFLASDAASWITGHTLVVDGGALAASLD
jgi:NAD(P)-dependent dehydrogenase (short-subunit alcohol dehydrogenase family)